MTPLDPPRWPDGPGICPVANLPGFLSTAELNAFVDGLCGSVAVKWLCAECGTWHYWPTPSEKHAATYKIPERIIDLIQKTKLST